MPKNAQPSHHDQRPISELPFELPGKIFRSPMPFGSFDRLSETWTCYQNNDINVVVILMEKQEYFVHARRDLAAFYAKAGLEVLHFPIRDYKVPTDNQALEDALCSVIVSAKDGKNLAIHCLAGLGRTGIFMACLAKRHFEMDGPAAIDWVRQYVPGAMENTLQEQFVMDF
jgi:protein-tyrosine phosphatase